MAEFSIGGIKILTSEGDLLFTATDALICPCFDFRNHDNGISRQIKFRAGNELISELSKKEPVTCLTKSHRLAMRRIKNIIHLNGSSPKPDFDSMRSGLTTAFQIANEKQFRAISLGSLNASSFKFSYETISKLIVSVIAEYSEQPNNSLTTLLIIDSNQNFLTILEEKLHVGIEKKIHV